MNDGTSPTFQHRARKRFGQNFLHDRNIINNIVKSISVAPDQCLVEIGPGKGAITEPLLDRHGQLHVIELDRDLVAYLRAAFATREGFTLHNQDVLKFDFNSLIQAHGSNPRPLVIVGNLPYNISTPLIFHLLSYHEHIANMSFMLQLEVVKRLCAEPGDNNYGRLSVMVQYYCRVEQLFVVPPSAFSPPPKVQSAIVRLTPHAQLPCPARDPDMLATVVRTAFNQRRKTIRNSLKSLLDANQLEALNIDLSLRPENLSLQDYVRISDILAAPE